MDKGHNFLHNHPMTEKIRGLDEEHVIVDRDAWEHARVLYSQKESDKQRLMEYIDSKILYHTGETK